MGNLYCSELFGIEESWIRPSTREVRWHPRGMIRENRQKIARSQQMVESRETNRRGPLLATSGCSAVSPRTSAVGHKADLRVPMSAFGPVPSASPPGAGLPGDAPVRLVLTRRRHWRAAGG